MPGVTGPLCRGAAPKRPGRGGSVCANAAPTIVIMTAAMLKTLIMTVSMPKGLRSRQRGSLRWSSLSHDHGLTEQISRLRVAYRRACLAVGKRTPCQADFTQYAECSRCERELSQLAPLRLDLRCDKSERKKRCKQQPAVDGLAPADCPEVFRELGNTSPASSMR